MLVRIVKMGFKDDTIDEFLSIFEVVKDKIRDVEGCEFLELYRARDEKNIFFTYSYWSSEEALEGYRASQLFKTTWKSTKKLFNQKPQAWSVDKLYSLD